MDDEFEKRMKALNDVALSAKSLLFSFLIIGTAICIVALSVSEEAFLRGVELNLPGLQISIPLVSFFWISPALIVFLHLNAFQRSALLRARILELRAEYSADPNLEDTFRSRLAAFDPALVDGEVATSRLEKWTHQVFAYSTLHVAAILMLLLIQARFVIYHSDAHAFYMTCVIGCDLFFTWIIALPANSLRTRKRQRLLALRRSVTILTGRAASGQLHRAIAGFWRLLSQLAAGLKLISGTRLLGWLGSIAAIYLSLVILTPPPLATVPPQALARQSVPSDQSHLEGTPPVAWDDRGWSILHWTNFNLLSGPGSDLVGAGDVTRLRHSTWTRIRYALHDLREPITANYEPYSIHQDAQQRYNLNRQLWSLLSTLGINRSFDLSDRDIWETPPSVSSTLLRLGQPIPDMPPAAAAPNRTEEESSNASEAPIIVPETESLAYEEAISLAVPMDLSGRDLRNADLSDAALPGASLDEARLAGASLDGVTLFAADLSRAHFPESSFRDADLRGVSFDGASFPNSEFDGTRANAASARRVFAPGSTWSGAELAASDFTHSNLALNRFRSVHAPASSFTGANLRGAVFSSSFLPVSSFYAADLSGSNFDQTAVANVSFTRSDLKLSEFDVTLSSAHLYAVTPLAIAISGVDDRYATTRLLDRPSTINIAQDRLARAATAQDAPILEHADFSLAVSTDAGLPVLFDQLGYSDWIAWNAFNRCQYVEGEFKTDDAEILAAFAGCIPEYDKNAGVGTWAHIQLSDETIRSDVEASLENQLVRRWAAGAFETLYDQLYWESPERPRTDAHWSALHIYGEKLSPSHPSWCSLREDIPEELWHRDDLFTVARRVPLSRYNQNRGRFDRLPMNQVPHLAARSVDPRSFLREIELGDEAPLSANGILPMCEALDEFPNLSPEIIPCVSARVLFQESLVALASQNPSSNLNEQEDLCSDVASGSEPQ